MLYQDVITGSVTILIKESSCVIVDNTSKVPDSKNGNVFRLWFDVVLMTSMLLMQSLGKS